MNEYKSPFLEDVSGLKKSSVKKIKVLCQFNTSEKCEKEYTRAYRGITKTMEDNSGKFICLKCSRRNKGTGRNNSGCKYKTLNDSYFNVIDTEEKAYLLGWIASDGCVGPDRVRIEIHTKDENCLVNIKNSFCEELPLYHRKNRNMVSFTIDSLQIANDLRKHLQIPIGKKSTVVKFPDLMNDDLKWQFIRGLFDGDGSVSKLKYTSGITCSIASISEYMKKSISDFCGFKNIIYEDCINFCTDTIEFLNKMYNSASPKLRLERKYQIYLQYLEYKPGLLGHYGKMDNCKYVKTDINAVRPIKNADESYNLTAISISNIISEDTIEYDTFIKFEPRENYNIKISLNNSGYKIEDCLDLIEANYVCGLKVSITKINKCAPDLQLPFEFQIRLIKS